MKLRWDKQYFEIFFVIFSMLQNFFFSKNITINNNIFIESYVVEYASLFFKMFV